MGSLGQLLFRLIQGFKGLSPAQRVAFVLIVGGTLIGLITLVVWTNRIDYGVLYSNLSEKDAGAIAQKLKEMKVPYRVGIDGHSILIPSGQIYETRLQLATSGLPQGGGVGFEIFDRTNFGMTDFIQHLNYQRALQGELSRTINQFSEVERSRVHLSIPKRSLFVEEQKEARASVVIDLKRGRQLNRNQVQGIVHLVASSAEGLSPENITVVDTEGRLLSEGAGDSNPVARLGQSQWEFQTNFEKTLEKRVQTMLEKAVGQNRVIVRVSADLDFKQIEETEETFDPETTAVRSEQRSEEKTKGGYPGPSGIPGVRSNLPPGQAQPASTRSSSFQKSDETINYEINRKTRRIVAPAVRIKKLSVAVLLDGSYEKTNETGGSEGSEYTPRTSEEMERYESIVKKAVGYDAERGDQIEVANISFQRVGLDEEGTGAWHIFGNQRFWSVLIRHGITVLSLIFFFLFILKPMVRWLTTRHGERELQGILPQGTGDLQARAPRLAIPEGSSSRRELIELATADKEGFARMVEAWLK
jgi:flagellar M-ring protein FliF